MRQKRQKKRIIMENSKKRLVLITGAGGRIGRAVIKRIADRFKVIGFDRSSAIFFSEDQEIIPLDVSNKESMISTFNNIKQKHGNKIHCVIHLAAYYSFEDNSQFKKYQKITVEGTRLLLQLLQSFEVDQFMFSSTMLVHKETPVGKKNHGRGSALPLLELPQIENYHRIGDPRRERLHQTGHNYPHVRDL